MDSINIPKKRGRPIGSKNKIINNEVEIVREQQEEVEETTIEEH